MAKHGLIMVTWVESHPNSELDYEIEHPSNEQQWSQIEIYHYTLDLTVAVCMMLWKAV